MASVPQWGHQRHIVFKTINQNVAKCHLFHDQRPWQGFSVDFVPFRIMASTAGHILVFIIFRKLFDRAVWNVKIPETLAMAPPHTCEKSC